MPSNLELKLRLDSHEPAAQIMSESGIKLTAVINQKDIYYRSDKGLLKLRLQDHNAELIKYLRDEKGEERWSGYEILLVGKDNAEQFLGSLFEIECTVEKVRQLYMYDNTRIHLDTVKNLGSFLELETLVLNGREDAIIRFDNTINLLKLNREKEIKKSYRDLILEKPADDIS